MKNLLAKAIEFLFALCVLFLDWLEKILRMDRRNL